MAITPREADTAYFSANSAKMAAAEAVIDRRLAELQPDYMQRRIVYMDKLGLSRREIDSLIEVYRGAGWRVEYKTAQRDGDWVEFYAT